VINVDNDIIPDWTPDVTTPSESSNYNIVFTSGTINVGTTTELRLRGSSKDLWFVLNCECNNTYANFTVNPTVTVTHITAYSGPGGEVFTYDNKIVYKNTELTSFTTTVNPGSGIIGLGLYYNNINLVANVKIRASFSTPESAYYNIAIEAIASAKDGLTCTNYMGKTAGSLHTADRLLVFNPTGEDTIGEIADIVSNADGTYTVTLNNPASIVMEVGIDGNYTDGDLSFEWVSVDYDPVGHLEPIDSNWVSTLALKTSYINNLATRTQGTLSSAVQIGTVTTSSSTVTLNGTTTTGASSYCLDVNRVVTTAPTEAEKSIYGNLKKIKLACTASAAITDITAISISFAYTNYSTQTYISSILGNADYENTYAGDHIIPVKCMITAPSALGTSVGAVYCYWDGLADFRNGYVSVSSIATTAINKLLDIPQGTTLELHIWL